MGTLKPDAAGFLNLTFTLVYQLMRGTYEHDPSMWQTMASNGYVSKYHRTLPFQLWIPTDHITASVDCSRPCLALKTPWIHSWALSAVRWCQLGTYPCILYLSRGMSTVTKTLMVTQCTFLFCFVKTISWTSAEEYHGRSSQQRMKSLIPLSNHTVDTFFFFSCWKFWPTVWPTATSCWHNCLLSMSLPLSLSKFVSKQVSISG